MSWIYNNCKLEDIPKIRKKLALMDKIDKELDNMSFMISVMNTCPFCNGVTDVEVNAEDMATYEDGGLAQDCFPYLSATDREVIISGICPNCQKEVFG